MNRSIKIFPKIISLIAFSFLLASCSGAWVPFLWKNYEHPSYGFSLKHPRSWELREGGTFGTTIHVLAPKKDPIFRANFNVVVQEKGTQSLDQAASLAEKHLKKLLDNYEVLARAERTLSGFKTLELRARYTAMNDPRILRTYILHTSKYEYVLTFTSREDTENLVQNDFHQILDSFKIPTMKVN